MSRYLPISFKWPSRRTSILLATAGLVTLGLLVVLRRRRRRGAYDDIYDESDVVSSKKHPGPVIVNTPKKPAESGDSSSTPRGVVPNSVRSHRSLHATHSNGGKSFLNYYCDNETAY